MEEKLLELFKIATEYAENSEENYMEIKFDYETLYIGIRIKKTYEYIVSMEFSLKGISIDKVIEKVKKSINGGE
jgi:hypothetical protein